MDNNIKTVLAFVAGATVGVAVTWKFVKTKYERMADEEIASVKEVFSKHKESEVSNEEPKTTTPEAYTNYVNLINQYTPEEGGTMARENAPYVISPDDFNEKDGYKTISLTYYSDGVVTDIDDNVVGDVEECIGEGSLTHFGEYEDDSVFVRNDELKTDFEILKDERSYTDVVTDEVRYYVMLAQHRDEE